MTQLIAPWLGVGWLLAALLFLTGAAALFVWPRWWSDWPPWSSVALQVRDDTVAVAIPLQKGKAR